MNKKNKYNIGDEVREGGKYGPISIITNIQKAKNTYIYTTKSKTGNSIGYLEEEYLLLYKANQKYEQLKLFEI